MPDAVPSRKRQVSRRRFDGSEGGCNEPLYTATAACCESGARERNFRIIFFEAFLAGKFSGFVLRWRASRSTARCSTELGEFISSLGNKGF
jgi:hypothetical protein